MIFHVCCLASDLYYITVRTPEFLRAQFPISPTAVVVESTCSRLFKLGLGWGSQHRIQKRSFGCGFSSKSFLHIQGKEPKAQRQEQRPQELAASRDQSDPENPWKIFSSPRGFNMLQLFQELVESRDFFGANGQRDVLLLSCFIHLLVLLVVEQSNQTANCDIDWLVRRRIRCPSAKACDHQGRIWKSFLPPEPPAKRLKWE